MKTFFQRSIAGLLLLAAGAAFAQNYPSKPVSLMVPYPAGGPSDAAARIFTAPLGKELGQQVIVDNLGGVSGALAAQKVLAAPADGYYLFQGSPNEVILAPLANAAVKLKAEDFRLVHPVTDAVMVVVARKDLPANNMDELIALARKSADKPLTYGSVGIGSLYHLILEDVQQRTGIQLIHAPYKGNAPLLPDIGGGQVDFAVLVYSAGHGRDGRPGPPQGDRPARRAALGAAEERADGQRRQGAEGLRVPDLERLHGAEEHARGRGAAPAQGHRRHAEGPRRARAAGGPDPAGRAADVAGRGAQSSTKPRPRATARSPSRSTCNRNEGPDERTPRPHAQPVG